MRFFVYNSTQLLTKSWPVSHLDMTNGEIRLIVPNSGNKEIKIPLVTPERWDAIQMLEDSKQQQKIVGFANLNGNDSPVVMCSKAVQLSQDVTNPRYIVYDVADAYVEGYGPDDACIIWHYITKNMGSGIVPMMTLVPPYGKNKIGIRTMAGATVKGAGLMTQFDKKNFNIRKAMANDWDHCPQAVFVMTLKPGSRWAFHGINMEYASGFCDIWEYVVQPEVGFARPVGFFRKLGSNQTQGITSHQGFIDWVDLMLKNPQMWRQDTREMTVRAESLHDDYRNYDFDPRNVITMLNQKVVHRPSQRWN